MHFTKCHACKTASVSSPTSGVQFMLSSMSDTPIETTAFFFLPILYILPSFKCHSELFVSLNLYFYDCFLYI